MVGHFLFFNVKSSRRPGVARGRTTFALQAWPLSGSEDGARLSLAGRPYIFRWPVPEDGPAHDRWSVAILAQVGRQPHILAPCLAVGMEPIAEPERAATQEAFCTAYGTPTELRNLPDDAFDSSYLDVGTPGPRVWWSPTPRG